MENIPKLINALKISSTKVSLEYSDGAKGIVDLSNFYENVDLTNLVINEDFNLIESNSFEVDSHILYSILTMHPITHKGQIVFNPALGKKAWV